jgi:hypothetical protein
MMRSIRLILLVGIALSILLILYGVWITPGAGVFRLDNIARMAPALAILGVYALITILAPESMNRRSRLILSNGAFFGILAGAVFAGEILLEYILLPQDNTGMGLVEFSLVFILFLLCGLWIEIVTHRFLTAVLAATWSALIASLIWFITVMAVYYAFRGSPQQVQVFQAEGNYLDFQRSGIGNFDLFILQDFFGACFFHLLLDPIAAVLLGSIGTGFALSFGRLRYLFAER